jgi:hypothetical protein
MNIYRKITVFASVIALLFVGCSKEKLSEINVNPNQAPDAPLFAVLNAAMTGSIVQIEGENARLAGMWTQQFTGQDRQYSSYNIYSMNAGNFDWTGYYYGMTQQANIAIEKANADGNDFYLGIALFTKAEAFGIMAALWGDLPYKQANDLLTFPNPQFDDQKEVINLVIGLFADAIAAFETGNGFDSDGIDWYYGGDAPSWIAASHTMMARYSLLLKDYTAAVVHANLGIMTIGGDMLIPHTGGAYNQDMNIYYSFGVFDREDYMGAKNAHLPSILDSAGSKNNAKTDESARFADLYVIVDDTIPGDYNLNYGSYFSATSPFPATSAFENLLILSESKLRNSDPSGALLNLNLARAELAAMYPAGMYDAYVLSDFDDGGIADHGKGGTDANLMYEIIQEKYASLVGQIEVFNDFRRTENLLGLSPTAGSAFPERFLIPQNELDGNPNAPSPIPGMFVKTPVNQ